MGCGEESTLSLFLGCFVVDLSIPGAKLLLPAALASAERSVLGDLKAAFCSTSCTVGSLGFVTLSQVSLKPRLTMNSWLSSCLGGLPNCWYYGFEPLAFPALTIPECSPMLASLVHVCLFVDSFLLRQPMFPLCM